MRYLVRVRGVGLRYGRGSSGAWAWLRLPQISARTAATEQQERIRGCWAKKRLPWRASPEDAIELEGHGIVSNQGRDYNLVLQGATSSGVSQLVVQGESP
jgi:hypothetical protein